MSSCSVNGALFGCGVVVVITLLCLNINVVLNVISDRQCGKFNDRRVSNELAAQLGTYLGRKLKWF